MNIKKLFFLLVVSLGITLAGCSSGEPSNSDIEKAVKTASQGFVDKVKKIGCVKAKDAGGYNCDVETETVMFGQTIKNASCLRFVKSDENWKATACR